MTQYDPLR